MDFRVKVILVGDTGVGKTSLVLAFSGDDPKAFSPKTTITPALKQKGVTLKDGRNAVLQIWDTAGQERYISISRLFYREATVAIVCVDGTRDDMKSTVDTWIKRVNEEVEQCQFIIAVTKSDAFTAEKYCNVMESVKYETERIGGSCFFITSAYTMDGIEAMFKEAAEIGITSQPMDEVLNPTFEKANGKGCC